MSGSVYPVSIDDITTLPQPGPNTVTNAGSITHAVLHDNEIQAITALETKLGIGSSTSTTSTVLRSSSNGTSTWGKLVLTTDVTGILPVGNGGTGITSIGTGVATFLSTPSSVNLATAVTDETGTGALVFGTSPNITTPTGIVKGDVGLGNVDNTSDATKNSAAVSLTNHDLSSTTNTFPLGSLVQVTTTTASSVTTGTTLLPFDNTIPQNTEGDQYMSITIVPKSTTNTLVIEVIAMVSNSAAGDWSGALFQNSTVNALAAGVVRGSLATEVNMLTFRHIMISGTTASTTFNFRAGSDVSGTTTFNGQAGVVLFGTAIKSSITIWEYKS